MIEIGHQGPKFTPLALTAHTQQRVNPIYSEQGGIVGVSIEFGVKTEFFGG
ncbi:MAG: hypothetical protein WAN87_03975 [Thermoplasmata archaeon]